MDKVQKTTTMYALSAAAAAGTLVGVDFVTGLSTDIKQSQHDKAFLKFLEGHIKKLGDRITLYHLLELADPNAEGLWFEGVSWSYRAMRKEVDRIAKDLEQLGVAQNELVAVYMTNSPEMLFTIYALSKLGAAPALINSALKGDTLLHCALLVHSRFMLCTPNLIPIASEAVQSSKSSSRLVAVQLGPFRDSQSLPASTLILPIPRTAENPPVAPQQSPPSKIGVTDVAAIIFTSGTTGLPKACSIKNIMVCLTSCPTTYDRWNPNRYLPVRTYACMPIFHGTTFFTGLCYSVGTSGCLCLSRKFSASKFWEDVCSSRSTRMLYVGELCRYLYNAPPSKYDRSHKCIVATGNCLQKDIWVKFRKRFGVEEFREYYRSTEGLTRFDNRNRGSFGIGKIGYAGVLKSLREKETYIVRFDHDANTPYRDPNTGFCVRANRGEPGEAVTRIRNIATFTNYHENEVATEAKILRNVFEKGDMFQRSGDLIVHESLGYFRFRDRIGDTFRWKGENVSAGEIRLYINELPQVEDSIVAGKKLEKYDGSAGIASVTLKTLPPDTEAEFIKALAPHLKSRGVPPYAFPRLVVVTHEITINATFKHTKLSLKNMSWDPASAGKEVSRYWLNGNEYFALDEQAWAKIQNGTAKL